MERHQARLERDLPRPSRELALAEAPARPAALGATLRESKEMVFILVGIALAFTIHFGFGDFVQNRVEHAQVRSPLAATEVGNSARVRAAAFERAGQRPPAAGAQPAGERAASSRCCSPAAAAARGTPPVVRTAHVPLRPPARRPSARLHPRRPQSPRRPSHAEPGKRWWRRWRPELRRLGLIPGAISGRTARTRKFRRVAR